MYLDAAASAFRFSLSTVAPALLLSSLRVLANECARDEVDAERATPRWTVEAIKDLSGDAVKRRFALQDLILQCQWLWEMGLS
jgi:hypothetical protein